jgi:deoxycytidylate deaminase
MACKRRKITAFIYDAANNLLGSGFNGPLVGECECPGKDVPAGGGGPDTLCFGMHAEIRALLSVAEDRRADMTKIVCTKAPCSQCVRVLLGTRINSIVFGSASNETENRALWERFGRTWEQQC